eukprot:6805300-Prorocentrum_lima.AAC.1
MTSSLVGSEMCIRDRLIAVSDGAINLKPKDKKFTSHMDRFGFYRSNQIACLLYTSDAADDM